MTTTIKVDDALRDRLKAQAESDGLTLGRHLARLADADDRRRRVEAARDAVANTPADELARYRAESAEWDRAHIARRE